MTTDQAVLFGIIILIFAFLIWGRFRYDLVAFAALILATLAGTVTADQQPSSTGPS